MERKNFISLIMGTIGGMFAAIGMCMCLLPQWNALRQGIYVGLIGIFILLNMLYVRRRMENKPPIRWNIKTIGTVVFGILSTLILGIGMCMAMVYNHLLIQGIAVGIIGILLLLSLIPICKGIK